MPFSLYLCLLNTIQTNYMNKKKTYLFGLLAGIALFFSACTHDTYTHQVTVAYPVGEQGFIYADQTLDSICFFTYDSYHYYPYAHNPANFISVESKYASKKIVNNPYARWLVSLPVYFTANTTDSCRLGYVMVDSKSEMDDWTSTVYGVYYQANWHCIANPAPKYTYNKNRVPVSVDHTLRDSTQTSEKIVFYAWDDWSITSSDPDRVKPLTESGKRSQQVSSTALEKIEIPLELVPNDTRDTICTNLLLQSVNGAKTVINIVQSPRK